MASILQIMIQPDSSGKEFLMERYVGSKSCLYKKKKKSVNWLYLSRKMHSDMIRMERISLAENVTTRFKKKTKKTQKLNILKEWEKNLPCNEMQKYKFNKRVLQSLGFWETKWDEHSPALILTL